MSKEAAGGRYSVYWRTWGFLLALTLVMVVLDQANVPRSLLVLVLVSAMLVKATLIAGTFMHLNQERVSLYVTVAVALLVTGTVLFVLIVPDGLRLLQMGN